MNAKVVVREDYIAKNWWVSTFILAYQIWLL
jgi:hypothetical protein